MKKLVLAHFEKNDPLIFGLFKNYDFPVLLDGKANSFERLVRAIIGQQLSVKAASKIYERLLKLLPQGKLTPENVLGLDIEEMRKAGNSYSKIKYIKDLAQKVKDKEVHLEKISKMDDEEVISELVKVKGIGRWTAEMFLMFSLGRPDVFSYGDLGLRTAMKRLYKLKNLPSEKQAERISAKWKPYRTYACRVLWRSLDNS